MCTKKWRGETAMDRNRGRLLLCFLWVMTAACSVWGASSDACPVSVTTPARLDGEGRVLAFVSTDKPIYRPGETVYVRAITLLAKDFLPVRYDSSSARLECVGPRGGSVASLGTSVIDSVAGFAWTIPDGTAGGRYIAKVSIRGGAVAERPFEIRVYSPPRLKSQIEFLREGYGPGDVVTAAAAITRAEGGVPVGAKVTAVARVDDTEVAPH